MIENISKTVGVSGKLASIRYVNIPVLELEDKERLKNALFEEMMKAIQLDKTHALVLGCTGFMGLASVLQEQLKQNGYDVPVIDPVFAATKMLETLITMGIAQSRLTYMTPLTKQRIKRKEA